MSRADKDRAQALNPDDGKSPQAYRTISEVSAALDVPQHVLRFWEGKFAQLKPMKRAGGRRFYHPGDVELLRGIQHLLYREGYSIKGVQKLFREQGGKFIVEAGRSGQDPRAPRKATRAELPVEETNPGVATLWRQRERLAELRELDPPASSEAPPRKSRARREAAPVAGQLPLLIEPAREPAPEPTVVAAEAEPMSPLPAPEADMTAPVEPANRAGRTETLRALLGQLEALRETQRAALASLRR